MGCDGKPNGSDLTIVTVILQYSVFATLCFMINQGGAFYLRIKILSPIRLHERQSSIRHTSDNFLCVQPSNSFNDLRGLAFRWSFFSTNNSRRSCMVHYPKIGWFDLSIDLISILTNEHNHICHWHRGDSFSSEYWNYSAPLWWFRITNGLW